MDEFLKLLVAFTGDPAYGEMIPSISKGEFTMCKVVEQFRNALPPVYNGENFMQAGGAYSHILVKDLGVYAPTYATFKRYVMPTHPDGIWVYLGNCLRNDTTDCTNLTEISRKNS